MARLLVTGGAGFIGANFVRHHAATHPADTLVVLDALTYAGNLASIQDVLDGQLRHFVRGDIGDEGLVYDLLQRHDIDTLVQLRAESHVDRSILGPDAFVQTNIVGTHALLKAARKAWLGEHRRAGHRFHHVSTDEVFGSLGPGDPAFTETTPYAPNSPYAASKAGSDLLVRAYQHTYGLTTTMTNCSNNYGPFQFPEKLIPLFIIRCLEGGPLPIYGDGMNVRDWLHVQDHCRGIEAVLARRQGRGDLQHRWTLRTAKPHGHRYHREGRRPCFCRKPRTARAFSRQPRGSRRLLRRTQDLRYRSRGP